MTFCGKLKRTKNENGYFMSDCKMGLAPGQIKMQPPPTFGTSGEQNQTRDNVMP